MPLLEIRGRAIYNAAPVRQNIPQEVLDKWRKEHTDHKTIIAFLKEQSSETLPAINDPVKIQPVDLTQYDALREVAYAN
jgi:hypothetical protein